ncbi:histidine kinase [uncultured Polaribacter sp.]|uniref:sensor histidine kinase n=1 Tax=uncultured Polaribacter sp. TaxID=174711 RepID=UPI002611A629|nr:histidine kinase [uncultured Polaribacter sp.]
MKKILYLLLFLFFGNYCYAQESIKLPEKPWVDILEIAISFGSEPLFERGIVKWKDSIRVKLKGNYTSKDSLQISKTLKKLDSVTETVSITFSQNKKANFEIKFLQDNDIAFKTPRWIDNLPNITTRSRKLNNEAKKIVYGQIIHYKGKNYNKTIKEIELSFAKILFYGNFKTPHKDSGFNIFSRRYEAFDRKNYHLTDNDLKIISEIYKSDFEEKLKLADTQFKEEVLEKIENYKIISRNKQLWWVSNPIAVVFVPLLLLFLLFLFFTSKVKNYTDKKLNNNFIKFLLVSLIAVCFLDILIIFSVSFFDHLRTPRSFGFSIVRFDTVFTTFVVSLFCFPFLFLFRYLEQKIEKTRVNITTKTSLIFLSTGMLPFVIILVIVILTIKENQNHQGGYTTLSYLFLGLMIIASLRALISYFIFKERNLIIENEAKLSNLRELKAKAELKSLQSQINPHFLYNSLNSIASLAPIDAIKTQKMAHSLSDLFKYSINRKDKKMSTIKDEIEMVKSYLEIEKIRFGERLQFNIKVDNEIENYEIPLFLIQPLVENAVKHGISQNEGKGKIGLKIDKIANELKISVSDNGPNFPEGLVSGHGLQTVYDLLRLSYGENASLNWTNTPKKIITITILETV